MVAHGVLLRSDVSPRAGRVPFELADFRDRSAPPAKSLAFSAFVHAYFRFLDYRSLLAAEQNIKADDDTDRCVARLDRVTKLQFLRELLLQIRPYGDGMEVPLVLEAMDCALIKIFQVYSEICVERFLAGVPGPAAPGPLHTPAAAGIKILWRAAEQSAQLSSYLELCRSLGVVNARRLPAFQRLPDEDVRELGRLLTLDADDDAQGGNKGTSPSTRLSTRTRLPRLTLVFFYDLLRSAAGNVWLRLAMEVRVSALANTSLMTMSRCGWQWSETSLGEWRGLRSFVAFLAEQPRQLKHLEWPGFRNTLRTATLTLLLVAVFIVVLSSVDAALCYVLSWLLRKSA
uniref:AP180 N-terminal homology (ANTH) domain-containing protein n=1 Tax=Oryza brachyantha TaxID=4533 RepID=J3MXZ9_ORYBR